MPQNCMVFFFKRHEPTRHNNLRSQRDSTKWPTVLFHKVKGIPQNIEAYVCGS